MKKPKYRFETIEELTEERARPVVELFRRARRLQSVDVLLQAERALDELLGSFQHLLQPEAFLVRRKILRDAGLPEEKRVPRPSLPGETLKVDTLDHWYLKVSRYLRTLPPGQTPADVLVVDSLGGGNHAEDR